MTDPEHENGAELKISPKLGAIGELAQIAFEAVGASLSIQLRARTESAPEIGEFEPGLDGTQQVMTGDQLAGGVAPHPTLGSVLDGGNYIESAPLPDGPIEHPWRASRLAVKQIPDYYSFYCFR